MERRYEFSLTRVQVCNWTLLAVLPLAAGLTYSWTIAGATLIGAIIANLSFILLRNDLTRLMQGPLQVVKIRFFIKYYLRLTTLAIVLYLLVRHGHVHVFGLLVGLSTVVAGIVVAAISQAKDIYFSGKEAV